MLGVFLIIYIVGLGLGLIFSGFRAMLGEYEEDDKIAARIALVSPVWPLAAPVLLWKAVRFLWAKADWKGIYEEERERRSR